ncbi:Peroxisomal membrane protein PEX25 [Spathaspora sp. JA1]|nr:Peroxisomal membrane protein PEX25 [Spathaspora sp. JA1]
MNSVHSQNLYTSYIPPQPQSYSKYNYQQQQQHSKLHPHSPRSISDIVHAQPEHLSHLVNNKSVTSTSPLSTSFNTYNHQPQPYFHSEWIDSPISNKSSSTYRKSNNIHNNNNSNYNYNTNMSSTATATVQQVATTTLRYETPNKSIRQGYITSPISDRHHNETHKGQAVRLGTISTPDIDRSHVFTPVVKQPTPRISDWDIFWAMLNDIVGKDKLAKIGQYTLRLLIHHAERSQSYLSTETVNISVINSRYNDNTKKLNLLKNFIKHPQDFIRIIIIWVCGNIKSKFSGMVNGLSMYRQFLRFGKTPFRIRNLVNKFANNINLKSNYELDINYDKILTKGTLGQFTSLYYGINDESLLLFKLKLLSNASYKKFASRHESFGWYSETWLAMYNTIEKLNKLSQQEMDLKISIQVRNKAKIISRQLLGNGNSSTMMSQSFSSNSANEDLEALEEIQFKKNNAWLDVYKNLADLGFNTYTVFKLRLPFATWQIWMGITASVLSTIKLYREIKKDMIEKELAKQKK